VQPDQLPFTPKFSPSSGMLKHVESFHEAVQKFPSSNMSQKEGDQYQFFKVGSYNFNDLGDSSGKGESRMEKLFFAEPMMRQTGF